MITLQVATAASAVGLQEVVQVVATLEAVAVAVVAVVAVAVAVITAISIPIMMMRKMISKIFLTVWKTLRFQTSIKFKC